MSPRSSVQTQRPCMPVRLSEKPIACAMNPTAGRCTPVSSTDPVRSKIAARSFGPKRSVRRVPAAVHVPSNVSHSPVGRVCGGRPLGSPHAAARRKAAHISHRHPGNRNGCCWEITFLCPQIRTTMLLLIFIAWLSGRLNRRRKIVFIGPPPVAIIDQLFERLGDGEHLIGTHARAGERRHATDG